MSIPVSVIATVKNEAASIQTLLDSLARQTHRPDDVVLVDGGSTDGTLQILKRPGPLGASLRVFSSPGANISEGRNRAIREAQHDLLLVTDAGVALPDDWVERLVAPFEGSDDVAMVGGFFASAPTSLFEWALGATTLPLVDEINPATFMPSHRSVAFRRSIWEALGGYPEWLDYCEDLLFDMRLRVAGYHVVFEPRATVAFQPRSNLRAFALQYLRYARGDGKARILLQRHLIRYAVYAGAVFLGAIMVRVPAFRGAMGFSAGGLAVAYCRQPWLRLMATRGDRPLIALLAAGALVPVLRLTGDLAKMIGFPAGLRSVRVSND
ncbi:MAG: glycosyltransferase [Chloroflexota bacterium]